MTATHARPQARAGGSSAVEGVQGAGGIGGARAARGFGDVLVLMLLPVPLIAAALPAAFAGGGTRRWFGGRGESQRADAQAAKDAAAAAFYELDTAQRDLRISIETITAVDSSPGARKAVDDFAALGRMDRRGQPYVHHRGRRTRPGPGRSGVGRRGPCQDRADHRQGRAGSRQRRPGPIRAGSGAVAGQRGDAARPARASRGAGPAGAPRREQCSRCGAGVRTASG